MSSITSTAAAEPAPSTDEAILDLSTLVDRKRITIDGKPFELRNVAEFGIVESHRFWSKRQQVANLADFESLTAEQAANAERALGEITSLLVVDLPDDVLEKLSSFQRSMIVEAWNKDKRPAETTEAGADAETPADPLEERPTTAPS